MRLRPRFGLAAPLWLTACGLTACGGGSPGGDPPAPVVWVTHGVRVNTVGYVSGRGKVATVVLPSGMTALANTTAEVFDMNDNLQWSCKVSGPFTDANLDNLTYYFADFSPFENPGTFYVKVPGLASDGTERSAPFQIAPDMFAGALETAMTGLYGQRCGTAVEITLGKDTWQHGACHQHDAASLQYLTGADTPFASVGGWHDGNDYGKYVNTGAFSAGTLLAAWDHFQPTLAGLTLPIPEHGKTAAGGSAPLPDFLWEVKWELDWLLTAQGASGGGGLPDKLTALDTESYGTMPEADGQKRYFSGVGTAMTADVVAVMAEAARIYQDLAPTDAANYLRAAQLGYQYLQANAGPAVAADESAFSTTFYDETDGDNRLWAAAELWETTGDPAALADFETNAAGLTVAADFDWSNVANLAVYTYLLSQRAGADARSPALVSALTTSLTTAAQGLAMTAASNAFGRALGDDVHLGSNGSAARAAMLLWVANTLGPPDPTYLDAIEFQVDFLLGRNFYDRSQVTMVGYHPPTSPHHGPSSGDQVADPWPGLLVGGASTDSQTVSPSDTNWTDVADGQVNGVAIDWLAPFVYATAALTPPPM